MRAELGSYTLEIDRDMRKLICQYSIRNIASIASRSQQDCMEGSGDRSNWKKVGWRGEVWKDMEGKNDELMSMGECDGYKTKVRDAI